MPDPVEVSIEDALLAHAQAFATAQSLAIAMPNVPSNTPNPEPGAAYLRASFMPAASFSPVIGYDGHVQHQGFLQIDVFFGLGAGELAPARVAAAAISYFARGTELTSNSFSIRLHKAAYRGPMMLDPPWLMIPVTIPYLCFAKPA